MSYPDNFDNVAFDSVWGEKKETEADLYMKKMQWVWTDLLNAFKEHCVKNKFKVSHSDVAIFAEGITDTLQRIADNEKDVCLRDTAEDVHPHNHQLKVMEAFSEIITLNKCKINEIAAQNKQAATATGEDFLAVLNTGTMAQIRGVL